MKLRNKRRTQILWFYLNPLILPLESFLGWYIVQIPRRHGVHSRGARENSIQIDCVRERGWGQLLPHSSQSIHFMWLVACFSLARVCLQVRNNKAICFEELQYFFLGFLEPDSLGIMDQSWELINCQVKKCSFQKCKCRISQEGESSRKQGPLMGKFSAWACLMASSTQVLFFQASMDSSG